MLTGRILVTGGAGFLARALYRRSRAENWPVEWTALSRDDAKHARLQAQYPEVACVLGDVAGMGVDRLSLLMRGFDVVIHAAASKYVDRAEHAAFDTVRTNVEGSRDIAMAAIAARVPLVIGISTDKAVAPVNTYGMSKALMERLFQEAGNETSRFSLVRYGNVVGSTGSVIPKIKALQPGDTFHLTDPAMTRYWMSPDEAVDTIQQAVHHGTNGGITIPKMRAMRMGDLVEALLPEGAHISIVGPRPGEKQHEAIVHSAESVRARSGVTPFIDRGGAPRLRFDGDYIELGSPTGPASGDDFAWSSDDPQRGWLDPDGLRSIVEIAGTI